MKWWPFKKPQKKVTIHDSKIHVKGTRIWLQNLQEICEKNFDNPDRIINYINQKNRSVEKHTLLFNHPEFLKA